MPKIGLNIPVYLSSDILFDFTRQTVESIKSKEHELILNFVINYSLPQYYPNSNSFKTDASIRTVQVFDNPKGNEVPVAWNEGIKQLLKDGCDYVITMNNDLILHEDCIDNLVKFGNEHQEFILWTASEWIKKETLIQAGKDFTFSEYPHMSLFMVNQKTMDTVGWFDENLEMAYFEDVEMHYRIILSGNKAGKTESAKFYHYGSRTIKADENLYDKNRRSYEDNRDYFKGKWGFDPHEKVFVPPESMLELGWKHPFNNEKMNWKDW